MRRILFMFAVAATAAGTVYGAAATLGGLQTQNIAADATTITPCDDNGVRIRAWAMAEEGYLQTLVTGAKVDHIHDNCAGKTIKVTVFGPSGTEQIEGTAVLPIAVSGTNDIEITVPFTYNGNPAATHVQGIARVEVMINDPELPQP